MSRGFYPKLRGERGKDGCPFCGQQLHSCLSHSEKGTQAKVASCLEIQFLPVLPSLGLSTLSLPDGAAPFFKHEREFAEYIGAS